MLDIGYASIYTLYTLYGSEREMSNILFFVIGAIKKDLVLKKSLTRV